MGVAVEMYKKIIYEKKYQQWFQKAENADVETSAQEETPGRYHNAEEFIKKLLDKAVFILIPERVESVPAFINLAIRTGEACLADTTIVEYDNHISAIYTLQKDVPYSAIKELALIADEVSFRNDEQNIYVSFDYYTYATYKSGKRIFPPELF